MFTDAHIDIIFVSNRIYIYIEIYNFIIMQDKSKQNKSIVKIKLFDSTINFFNTINKERKK